MKKNLVVPAVTAAVSAMAASFLRRKVIIALVIGTVIAATAFAQKTEFKLGVGGGLSAGASLNNFFDSDTQWWEVNGGAHLFFDVTYVLFNVDFFWGVHNVFGDYKIGGDAFNTAKVENDIAGITYTVFLQYPRDYLGGRSVFMLGVGYKTYTTVKAKSAYVPLSSSDLDSLWLKIGYADHKSLSDLLYFRYNLIYDFYLSGGTDSMVTKSGPEVALSLGFWVK